MGMLKKSATYTVTIAFAATSDDDWTELQTKLLKVSGIQSVVLEEVKEEVKHVRGEWNAKDEDVKEVKEINSEAMAEVHQLPERVK